MEWSKIESLLVAIGCRTIEGAGSTFEKNGIRDVISFNGESVTEIETAFHDAVDNYLAACRELGQKPNKPYSGKLMLRVPAEIHAAVASAAEASGKSINQWAAGVLDKASHAH